MYNIFRYKMTNKRDNSMIQWNGSKFGQVQVYLSVPVLGHDMEHLSVVSQFIPQAEMSCTTVAATQQMKMAVDRFIACVKNDVEICVINIKSIEIKCIPLEVNDVVYICKHRNTVERE